MVPEKKLAALLDHVEHELVQGDTDIDIASICLDSRKVRQGSLFVAIVGHAVDGHDFIKAAIEAGAAAVLLQDDRDIQAEVTIIRCADSRRAVAWCAANFYGHPSTRLTLTGITGTNGKTSVAYLSHQLLTRLGYTVGLISTVEIKVGQEAQAAHLTTPDPIKLQATLRTMVDAGCSHVFMEVSSHALVQHRVDALHFDLAVFTNISHDHLDYHGTFAAYLDAKKVLFDRLDKGARALINLDDRRADYLVQNTQAEIHHFALQKAATYKGKILDNLPSGLHMIIDGVDLYAKLIGAFNASNLLAVYGITRLLGLEKLVVLQQLSGLQPPPGRFELVHDPRKNVVGLVDYAHTPDALKKVLQTIQQIKTKATQVITVVGAGGDRDTLKRPKMAQVACQLSDLVLLTSDNPRSEDPDGIIADMEEGIPSGSERKVLSISDRRQAIRAAYKMAQPGAILLIAGKGHESYQEIKGVRHPFDDRVVLAECFE